MPGLYLAIIIGGILGMLAIDFRLKLAITQNRRATLLTLLASVAFFSLWDSAGIYLGIFFKGQTSWLVGLDFGPQYPIEEFFFLLLFSYTTLVVYKLIERTRGSR
ncbi:MAG: lycopene cyclase domain-containing protein [Micrococcales bacterium]